MKKSFILLSNLSFARGAFTRKVELCKYLSKNVGKVYWIGPKPEIPIEGVNYIYLSLTKQLNNIALAFHVILKMRMILRAILHGNDKQRYYIFVAFHEFDVITMSIIRHCVPNSHIVWCSRGDILANDYLNISRTSSRIKRISSLFLLQYHLLLRHCAVKFSNNIIVQTSYLKDQIAYYYPTFRSLITVLPNNVNASWMINGSNIRMLDSPRKSHNFRLIYVGRVARLRGIEDIIRAVHICKTSYNIPVIAQIVGPNCFDYSSVMRLASLLSVEDSVVFIGETDGVQMLMAESDALIAARYVDHCPNVVLEGLAVSLPIIATNIPAHQFILGENWPLYYEPGQYSNLALLISSLYHASPEKLHDLKRSLKVRSDRFSFDWQEAMSLELAKLPAEHDGNVESI